MEEAANHPQMANLTSLLKWSVAHTEPESSENHGLSEEEILEKRKRLQESKGILDELFPDVYAQIREMVDAVKSDTEPFDRKILALSGLQEYMEDRNHAINIVKVGILSAVLDIFAQVSASLPPSQSNAEAGITKDKELKGTQLISVPKSIDSFTSEQLTEIRKMCVWIIGSALQDDDEVKGIIVGANGVDPVIKSLSDPVAEIRAKAVHASAALLKNAPQYANLFELWGGAEKLAACVNDPDRQVRSRCLFFLQNALATKNQWFVEYVCVWKDGQTVGQLVDSMTTLDPDDIGPIEDVVRCCKTLASSDAGRELLRKDDVTSKLKQLETRVSDEELLKEISTLVKVFEKILR